MCFSAGASFTSGVVLAVAGVVSLRNAKTVPQKLFASIPLIFSIQQITEGFLWLALQNNDSENVQEISTILFLTIAQVIWPVFVPLSIGLLETKPGRKKAFIVLTTIGSVISVSIIYCLFNYTVHAKIDGHHIAYKLNFPDSMHLFGGICYFIATIFPAFTSSVKKMPLLGFMILISYIVSAIFFEKYVISVWCFFAAALSVVIYFISLDFKKTETENFRKIQEQTISE